MTVLLVIAYALMGFVLGTQSRNFFEGLLAGTVFGVLVFLLLLFMWPVNLIVLRTHPEQLSPMLYYAAIAIAAGMAAGGSLPANSRLKKFLGKGG